MVMVPLSEIILDYDIYPRTEVSASHVRGLREAVATGVTLPPIIVDRASKRIVDGFHRYKERQSVEADMIDVEFRDYPDEAAIFEASIDFNRGHGLPLQRYDLQRGIIKLEKLGFSRDRISEIVRMPVGEIEKIKGAFATTRSGDPIPIKRGLEHLRQTTLSKKAEAVNEGYAGFPAAFYAKQVRMFLTTNPPIKDDLIREMEALIDLWNSKFATGKAVVGT